MPEAATPKSATRAPVASTLVADAITNPAEPRHFMVVERLCGRATARIGTTVVAVSDRALVVKEVGRSIQDPVVYFPPGDVRGERLTPVEGTTACPIKGVASYYDIAVDTPATRAAWSYQSMHDFDRRLAQLESCVAFDRTSVTIEVTPIEEN